MYRRAVKATAALLFLLTVSADPTHVRSRVVKSFVVDRQPLIVPDPVPPDHLAPCPDDMVLVQDFCVDRYEAPNEAGRKPLVMYDALQSEAWCAARGKRLCSEIEWEAACFSKYPYGESHEEGRCNDGKKWMDRNEAKLNTWPSDEAAREVERVWQGEPSGSRPGCVSPHGVHDLTGNVEEWVSSGSGYVLKGCFWAACFTGPKPTCQWANGAHGPRFKYYETGFRCCSSAMLVESKHVDDLLPRAR